VINVKDRITTEVTLFPEGKRPAIDDPKRNASGKKPAKSAGKGKRRNSSFRKNIFFSTKAEPYSELSGRQGRQQRYSPRSAREKPAGTMVSPTRRVGPHGAHREDNEHRRGGKAPNNIGGRGTEFPSTTLTLKR